MFDLVHRSDYDELYIRQINYIFDLTGEPYCFELKITFCIMTKTCTKTLILLASLLSTRTALAQDYLVDHTFLGTRSAILLSILFQQPVDYGVDLYKIRYITPGVDQLPDTASGLMVVPQVPPGTLLPIVIYGHGTTSGPTDVPSQLKGGYEVAMAYAALGFITIAPDYLGLGDSRGFHPYVHAATESSASLDMLNGCLEYLDVNEPEWDLNHLFITGYSQGGHTSMALHRDMEEIWSFVYPVTAATHMSGPYSISGVMRDKILSDESYGTPAYIAYTLLGYNEVYENLYTSINEIFKEPFATSISHFRDGSINLSQLNAALVAALAVDGDTVNKRMFQDSILTAIVTQPDHVINVALEDNDTYNWAPTAPTRLYYCGADEQVPFQNSLVAEAIMQGLGAADLQALNLNNNYTHGECVLPAVTNSINFFKSFLNPSSLNDFEKDAEPLKVFPNPAQDEMWVEWENAKGGMNYEIINAQGQQVQMGRVYANRISVNNLSGGVYVVVCTVGNETRVSRFVHQ